jgi:hypothetical protein
MHNINADRASEHDRALGRRDDFRQLAWISLGISAGIAATGLVLYVVDPPQVAFSPLDHVEPPRPRPHPLNLSLAPVIGPGFAGLAAVGKM